ncbi:ribosome biogenesis regulatory protein homolog [Alligator mississippiensis]|uniref:ribosome biogenesis regulatory protein homolog n=1 Tax=Alligator mississippiensis TaxID=8496 RepID=UPI0028779512|nr:ribosome biogenesis regulatory protein homolog [Alligator mississippiensis]
MAAPRAEELLAGVEPAALPARSLVVHKELELDFDLGNLLARDGNPPPRAAAAAQREAALRALARDNAQLLAAELWALPARRPEGEAAGPLLAELPPPATRLPREKPPPRPRPPTRWERFAQLKGIRRRKRPSLVWDAAAGDWRRRWGYGRAGGDPARAWLAEVPPGADPLQDQLGRQRREKRERVARNEFSRLRNLARASSFHPTGHQGRQELGRAACLARASTASLGRFQPRLPRESPLPLPRSAGSGKKKRRFAPLLGDLAAERGRQLELVRTLAKPPPLDVARATNKQLRQEDAEVASTSRAKGRKRSERGKRARGRGTPQQRRRGQQKQQRPAGGKRRKR